MTISIVTIPNATAQSVYTTYAYIGATPNPVGVCQETLLHAGIITQLTSAEMGWEGLSITIEKPDGTTETFSDIRTDATGGTGRVFIPEASGNYTLQTHFPEQVTTATKSSPGVPEGTTMLASSSEPLTLTVQEDPISIHPGYALPTEYWTRPIDAQFREWSVLAGNWLEQPPNLYAVGNEDAPETAHILWTRPLTQGGLVGEPLGEHAFEEGDAYEGKFVGSIVLAGKLYYNKYAGPSSGAVDIYREYVCVDLRTGEELWSKVFLNHMTLARGQIMYWDTYDYHGAYDYLWFTQGSTWVAFDAFTGDWVYNMTNVPSGNIRYGSKGEILIYTVNRQNGWMTMWNSSNVPALYQSNVIGSMGWGQWRPYGKVVNAQAPHGVTFAGAPYNTPTLPTELTGYQWNVSIPTGLPGSVNVALEDRIIGSNIPFRILAPKTIVFWGLSTAPGDEGTLLFNRTWNPPSGNVTLGWGTASLEEGVFTIPVKDSRAHFGFSIDDGRPLWGPTESQPYLDFLDITIPRLGFMNIAYGKLFSSCMSGTVNAYNVQTGDLLWTYNAIDPLNEILWSNNWPLLTVFIADEKIYLFHAEHSPVDPKPRGAPFICLNATTGEEIWRIDGLRGHWWGGRAVIGDSVIATYDTYDQRIYAIGKGPSATTVTAGPEVSVEGSSVLVKGMVTDISPGTDDLALQKRFPNGIPAVSDANMSNWMLYVYKQFAQPADTVGVEVIISVLDPNNNCYEVGRTTSDEDGFFKLAFEPEVPGEYTVVATFEGSKSYYGSLAETAILVEEAPAATPAPTPSPAPMTDMYVTGFGAGMIIAIVVVGLLLFMMLRKR